MNKYECSQDYTFEAASYLNKAIKFCQQATKEMNDGYIGPRTFIPYRQAQLEINNAMVVMEKLLYSIEERHNMFYKESMEKLKRHADGIAGPGTGDVSPPPGHGTNLSQKDAPELHSLMQTIKLIKESCEMRNNPDYNAQDYGQLLDSISEKAEEAEEQLALYMYQDWANLPK
jgi:hypothetical protein